MLDSKNLRSVRVIAMFGIVFIHALLAEANFINPDRLSFDFFSSVISLFKFSTIVFFVISGYLFELNRKKYPNFNTLLSNKYKKLLKPYLLLFLLPICLFFIILRPHFNEVQYEVTFIGLITDIGREVFLSNYWFIPVLLLYFIINFFVPYRVIKFLFPLSIAITLFYSTNLYFNWIRTEHSLSFLGFLSFFFFGRMQVHKVYKACAIKVKVFIVILLLLFSIFESHVLFYNFNQQDAFNTLRVSNIFYSIGVVALLKHLAEFPKKILQVNTYYIYLIHPHLLKIISFIFKRYQLYLDSPIASLLFALSFVLICITIERINAGVKNWRAVGIKKISLFPLLKSS